MAKAEGLSSTGLWEYIDGLTASSNVDHDSDYIMIQDASSTNTMLKVSPIDMIEAVFTGLLDVAPPNGSAHVIWETSGLLRRATITQLLALGGSSCPHQDRA